MGENRFVLTPAFAPSYDPVGSPRKQTLGQCLVLGEFKPLGQCLLLPQIRPLIFESDFGRMGFQAPRERLLSWTGTAPCEHHASIIAANSPIFWLNTTLPLSS